MPCDAPASPDAEREAEQLLEAYITDGDGWWWGCTRTTRTTRITCYSTDDSYTLKIERCLENEELVLLANNYLNLLKVQQSAT